MPQSVNLGSHSAEDIVLLCVLKSICWSCPSQTLHCLKLTVTITMWVKDHIKPLKWTCVFSGSLFLNVDSASRDIPHIKPEAMIMIEISTVTVIFLYPSLLLEDISLIYMSSLISYLGTFNLSHDTSLSTNLRDVSHFPWICSACKKNALKGVSHAFLRCAFGSTISHTHGCFLPKRK